MSCTYADGTKVVRKTFDFARCTVFSGLKVKAVQSIIGATEKRREGCRRSSLAEGGALVAWGMVSSWRGFWCRQNLTWG